MKPPDNDCADGPSGYLRCTAKRYGKHPELCLSPRSQRVSAARNPSRFHVTNDTKVIINTVVTIEAQVAHGANTGTAIHDLASAESFAHISA